MHTIRTYTRVLIIIIIIGFTGKNIDHAFFRAVFSDSPNIFTSRFIQGALLCVVVFFIARKGIQYVMRAAARYTYKFRDFYSKIIPEETA